MHQHSVSNNHPKANISHFKIINQDSKQVAREAREAIHIRINNPALNCNMGKSVHPGNLLTTFLEQMNLPISLSHRESQTSNRVTITLLF